LMGLPLCRNSTPMSLQNEHMDGTLHCAKEPSGMRVHMKVSTLERSEGVEMLVVEEHRPPYDRQKDLTIIELGRESMRRGGGELLEQPSTQPQPQWIDRRGHWMC